MVQGILKKPGMCKGKPKKHVMFMNESISSMDLPHHIKDIITFMAFPHRDRIHPRRVPKHSRWEKQRLLKAGVIEPACRPEQGTIDAARILAKTPREIKWRLDAAGLLRLLASHGIDSGDWNKP